MPNIGQIISVEYDGWSSLISPRDDVRMDTWQGRDPATGMRVENPPSAMRVKFVPDDTPVGLFAYDEEHRAVIIVGDDEYVPRLTELGHEFAAALGGEFSTF
ncbi:MULTISPECIES: hypothetical protein [Rhodopirellula]|uniref:hypothetical protein n=1 Tax=Rhodopirellula TaxID=265488 RepID=UPI00257EAD30|nr:hypothetical protein [Rhodopirellula sp. UBA1907]